MTENCSCQSKNKKAHNGSEYAAAECPENDSCNSSDDGETFSGFEILVTLVVVMMVVVMVVMMKVTSGHIVLLFEIVKLFLFYISVKYGGKGGG